MRHNKKNNHLGRTHSHKEAMLSNMSVSLIKHKRIFTTLAKAKELRKYIEPLITKSKEDTTNSRRIVFQNLKDKYAVTELFKEISQKIGDRPGGYTRIIKTGNRLGDNASMCMIELVDYNELMLKDKKAPAKAKTRRSRKKSDVGTAKDDSPKPQIVQKKAVKEPAVEEVSEAVGTETEIAEVTEIQETEASEMTETAKTEEITETEPAEPEIQDTDSPTEEPPIAKTPIEPSKTEEEK